MAGGGRSWWRVMLGWLWDAPPPVKTAPDLGPSIDRHEETVVAERRDLARLRVSGMSGEACAETVRKALLKCEGVASVTVGWETRIATVYGSGLDPKRLASATAAVGYTAVPLKHDTDS